MIVFLDTSSLVKLYFKEQGTEELDLLFRINTISEIFLAEITKVEFASTIWKKVRTKEISESVALTTLEFFESDYHTVHFRRHQ